MTPGVGQLVDVAVDQTPALSDSTPELSPKPASPSPSPLELLVAGAVTRANASKFAREYTQCLELYPTLYVEI